MMRTSALVVTASLLLGACSLEPGQPQDEPDGEALPLPTPENHDLVNALVDSFDAPACLGAALRYSGRKSRPEGEYVAREFVAPVSCIYQLIVRAEELGFSEIAKNTYAGQLSSGSEDRIKIEVVAGENAGSIEWEVDVK